jgi:hypothetical protein
MQMDAARHAHIFQRTQITGMRQHRHRRDQAARQQFLGAVEIGKHQVQQRRALNQRRLDGAPFLGRDHQRQRIELPGPVQPLIAAIDVVGDAVLADQPQAEIPAAADFFVRQTGQEIEKTLGVGTRHAVGTEHLVPRTARQRIAHAERPGQYSLLGAQQRIDAKTAVFHGN